MQKEIKKRARLYGLAAVLLAVILVSMCYQLGYVPQIQTLTPSFMSTFSSFDELRDFLKTKTKSQYGYPYAQKQGGAFLFGTPETNTLSPTLSPTAEGAKDAFQYSTTNIQVAGVDEADTVKTDGQYIYLIEGNNVSILRAYPPEQAQLVSTMTFSDTMPVGIFVNGDRLAVLESNYSMVQEPVFWGSALQSSYFTETKTSVEVYDVSNRSKPELLTTFNTTGTYFGSRMIGDYVYLIASQPAYYRVEVRPGVIVDKVDLPKIESSGQSGEVAPTEVYYSNVTDDYFMFTTIAALNIKNVSQSPSSKTLMIGGASTMYVSLTDIYVTYATYDQVGYAYEQTSIYRIHVENGTITPEAQGKVPGHILNQFSMDQYGDYFRVATTTWGNPSTWVLPNATDKPSNGTVVILPILGAQQSNVYVLNMNLSIIGRLESLAPGENFHSARFMGNRCYLVTFMMTDPLFVIDLSNPAKPTELGNLTIPGYSDYLHPYDENHLIGIGKETTASEQAYFAWYQGVKISLFDVSNVSDPKQIANYTIGDRGTNSPVLSDHRAFLFDKSKNLLVIPVLVAKIDPSEYPEGVPLGAYGQPVWQGAYVFNITLENGLVLRGNVTHMENGIDIWNSSYYVERSLYIENVLYTVSKMKVKLNGLEDLAFIKEIRVG